MTEQMLKEIEIARAAEIQSASVPLNVQHREAAHHYSKITTSAFPQDKQEFAAMSRLHHEEATRIEEGR